MSASSVAPGTLQQRRRLSRQRLISSSCRSTIIASLPTRWNRAASLAIGMRNAAGYTAHVSSQSIHATRDNTARALDVAPAAVRFVAPDVGGGFGAKNFIYPEHVLTLWAAKRVRRPVKWVATRSEVFLADHQARDHTAEAQ